MQFFSSRFFRAHEHALIALGIGIVVFAAQFLLLPYFGTSWDEPLHRNWATLSLLALRDWSPEITLLMPGFGMFYGPLFFIFNLVLADIFTSLGFAFYQANHIGIIVISSIGLSFCYLLGELVGHRRTGFLTVFFCIFYLPFVAHAQFNPKDIPLFASTVATVFFFLRGIFRRCPRSILIAAALFGLSLSMKVIAILMLPALFLTYSIFAYRRLMTNSRNFDFFKLPLLAAVVSIAFCFLTWPTAWLQPSLITSSLLFFAKNSFWHGSVLYFGTLYDSVDLPWHYVLFEYFSTMPVLMILCFLSGVYAVLRSFFRYEDRPDFLFLILWIFVPLLVASDPRIIRYDGMRQFFFVLPAIAIVSALGLERFFVFLERVLQRPSLAYGILLIVFFLSFLFEAWVVFPYFGSYRNELMRLWYPKDMHTLFEVDYFGYTIKDGITWLNANAAEDAIVCVPTAGFLVEWYERRPDLTFACSKQSTYVMVFMRNRSYEGAKDPTREPVYRISRMGTDLLKIYQL